MWNRSPVQVQCMRKGPQGWCAGMTLSEEWDGEGGRSGFQDGGHMYTYDWFMWVYGKKTLQYCKVISLKLK